jgi:membrane protease YdiL (CAAX protease family)
VRRFYDNRVHGGLLIAMLIIPYILTALPTANTHPTAVADGLARMLAYLFVPGLVLLLRPVRNKPLDPFDLLAILALWLPVEFDWLPDASVPLMPGVQLPVPKLTAVCLGFLLFLVIRPVERLNYTYQLGRTDVLSALLALAAFALVGVPLGMAMGFIQAGLAPFDAVGWLLKLLAIYFLTAVPEELLFRGIIQNLIEQRFGQTQVTWIAAAVIFGLSHINNATAHHVPPNWPYVIMATLAGLAYGWAWRKSGKITASAITHTLVNFIWGVVFGN